MLPLQHEAGPLLLQVSTWFSVRNTQIHFDSRSIISSRPRDLSCFNYFCHGCWEQQHVGRTQHKPLMRNIRFLFISVIALFASAVLPVSPCYCLRNFHCHLFHCCSCSSLTSNFRGLTRARAGPTSLPPDFGE